METQPELLVAPLRQVLESAGLTIGGGASVQRCDARHLAVRKTAPASHRDCNRGASVGQFLKQRLVVLQIGGVEAFAEPVVDVG